MANASKNSTTGRRSEANPHRPSSGKAVAEPEKDWDCSVYCHLQGSERAGSPILLAPLGYSIFAAPDGIECETSSVSMWSYRSYRRDLSMDTD